MQSYPMSWDIETIIQFYILLRTAKIKTSDYIKCHKDMEELEFTLHCS
jgi:hypothetical protein